VSLAGLGALGVFAIVAVATLVRGPHGSGTSGLASSSALATPPPSPTASATTSPSAAADEEAELAALSPAELRKRFVKNVRSGQMAAAVTSLERLLSAEPAAAEDRELRDVIVDLTQRITQLDGPAPDRLFDLVAQKMGTTGGDLLYELWTTKGGSRAAKRAEDLLRDAALRERSSPAMRIAYELRDAKRCEDKIALFSRAATDGDGRTLGQLQILNRSCRNAEDCCLHNDARLRTTMDAIKARQR
jgi:hypothetical protein